MERSASSGGHGPLFGCGSLAALICSSRILYFQPSDEGSPFMDAASHGLFFYRSCHFFF